MDRKLLKKVQTITTFRNRLANPVGTRRGPPLVRGPQFENRWYMQCQQLQTEGEVYDLRVASFSYVPCVGFSAHVEIAHRIVSYRMY